MRLKGGGFRKRLLAPALAGALLAFCQYAMLGQTAAQPKSPADQALEQAIHDYILAHPEVLVESLRLAKERAEQRAAAATKALIRSFRSELVADPHAPALGNPNGDVTIVEFLDYRCPYCRQVDPLLRKLVNDDPGLRLVQKQFPILGPLSVFAARVAIAAHKQSKHGGLHDALMGHPIVDEAGILQLAAAAGVDLDRLKVEIASAEVESEIEHSTQIARALRLQGTPAFIVGTELVPGVTDRETLTSLVEDARRGIN